MKNIIIITLMSLSLNLSANDKMLYATSNDEFAVKTLFLSSLPGGWFCGHVFMAGSNNIGDAYICAGAGLSTNLALTTMILRTYEMANDDAINFEVTHEITDALQEALDFEFMRFEDQSLEEAIANIITVNSLVK